MTDVYRWKHRLALALRWHAPGFVRRYIERRLQRAVISVALREYVSETCRYSARSQGRRLWN